MILAILLILFLCPQCNTKRMALQSIIFTDLRDRNDPKVQIRPVGYVCPCGYIDDSFLHVDLDVLREQAKLEEQKEVEKHGDNR